jgi:hypothetical protein
MVSYSQKLEEYEMKHVKWISLALCALVMATLACGGGGTPTSAPLPTPRPTEPRPAPTAEEGATASLEIVNDSSVDVWYVYISPSASSNWGDDWLGSHVIAAGERYTVTGIEPDTYDLKAEDADHNVLATETNVELDGANTWTLYDTESGGEVSQWATGAAASSEYGNPSWAAIQATGAPDTAECGDSATAWASLSSDTEEWIELTYDTPVYATAINIYQSYNPDQVVKVELIDLTAGYHAVYTGRPEQTDECPYVLSIPVEQTDYSVAGVRITIDQSQLGLGWNEIDAVELVGVGVE